MTEHALFGASSSRIWMNCSEAARHLDKPYTPSIYAKEGTAAHKLAETCFRLGGHPSEMFGETVDGFEVDGEMRDAVSVFVDYVRNRSKFNTLGRFYYEQRVYLNELFEDFEDGTPVPLFGTGDVIHVFHETITVIDYKHGSGVKVLAENNPQLMYYALGAYYKYKKPKTKYIRMVIVQPRAPGDNISEFEMSVDELLQWGHNVLRPAILQGVKGPWNFNVGDWCKFCKNNGNCEALHKLAQEKTRREFQKAPPVNQDTTGLTNEELADVLEHRDLVRKFISAAESEAINRLSDGQKIPGFKLVHKTAKREWQDEAVAEELLKDQGLEPFKEPVLKTPPMVEKEIGKKSFAAGLGQFVHKPTGGYTVAPDSDPRKTVTSTAADDFAGTDAPGG